MGKRVMMGFWAFGLIVLLMSSAKTVHGITCGGALIALQPCLSFLVGIDPSPDASCCQAVASINQQANTKEIRQQLCQCFKQSGSSFGVQPEKAKQIPDLCHVQVPVPIDPNVDCST
ncbi:hypothetical protein JCGZ_15021 [Jatropha curcas]|uniref:Non-specific lipid-transfer protein n=2 Tax=Jatropha curcas TaxID=180498 RepID=A0A067L9M5_JATCU|nr:hypothetical protein JCGZ_15021 [Jatropha curcas]